MIRSSLQSGFDSALAELAAAIAADDSERASAAYLAIGLLWQGTVPALLERIEHSCGQGSGERIIHAFSHRQCYMCQNGATTCPSCEGAGGDCTACGGLGMEACGFCGGTGWGSEELIPAEFRSAVRHIHANHAVKQAQKLSETRDPVHFASSVAHLRGEKQVEVGLWLLRLKCRFAALASQATDRKQVQYEVLSQHAGKLLDAIRSVNHEEHKGH